MFGFFKKKEIVEQTVLEDWEDTAKSNFCCKETLVSEPVFSFIRLLEEEPKRFKLSQISSYGSGRKLFRFSDRVAGEAWEFTSAYGPSLISNTYRFRSAIPWATEGERKVIEEAIKNWHKKRQDNIGAWRSLRRARKLKFERERLIGVYCKNIDCCNQTREEN